MGAVSFSIDPGLIGALRESLPLDIFVETGTYKGDTLALVNKFFRLCHSVELSSELHKSAEARFVGSSSIKLHFGNSPAILKDLECELSDQSVLYFLDAHWCVDANTAGISSQCPLLSEIKALRQLNERSVLVIDDARLFLSPPPAPHSISDWPMLTDVLFELRQIGPNHKLMILNDTIIMYPAECHDKLSRYARERGVDWLNAMVKVRDYDNLRIQFNGLLQQLKDKDLALTSLHEKLNEDRRIINELSVQFGHKSLVQNSYLVEVIYDKLLKDISGKVLDVSQDHLRRVIASYGVDEAALIKSKEVGLSEAVEAREDFNSPLWLHKRLIEKEAVISELRHAIFAYKSAFFVFGPVVRFVRNIAGWSNKVSLPIVNFFKLFTPKIGKLYHHPPVEIMYPRTKPDLSGESLPTLTVVTPSFQQGHFIERTLRSVLEQGYAKLEYVVQDGGSTDSTVECLKRHETRFSKWRSEPDDGQSQAINRGFSETHGEIMGWLNSDDLLLPGALHRIGRYFARHPNVDAVYGNRILIDENDCEIGRWVLPGHDNNVLSWADYIPQETLFWRRSLWDRVGGIDEKFSFAMDWDLLLRFRDAGANIVHIPYFIGAFRVHKAQKTSAIINSAGIDEMMILRKRSLGREVSWNEIRRNVLPYLVKHLFHDWCFRVRRRLGFSE